MKDEKTHHASVAAAVILIVLLVTSLLYLGCSWYEQKQLKPEKRGNHQQRYEYDVLLDYKGKKYRRKQNLTTILVMGIDKREGAPGFYGPYRNGGQADFLRLMVADAQTNRLYQLEIDRDTMTDIAILGIMGDPSGMRKTQICLSHGFGDGKEQSCQFTVDAVSRLLLDTPIPYYLAVNMNGIPTLNDLAGGVTVTLEDDFSHIDPEMVLGKTMNLTGKQAEIFVRGRMNVGAGTNEARMVRQNQYLQKLGGILQSKISEDRSFANTLYDGMEPYLVTNMSKGLLINEIWAVSGYEVLAPVKPDGSYQIGTDGFMEYHVDEEKLSDTIMNLFCEPIDDLAQ